MGASYSCRCIVLKKTKLGESDLILTMLSQDGRQVKGVAKGARKPGNKRFGARLEPFSVVDLQLYPGKNLDNVTEVRCVTSNAACRTDLDRSAACSLMAELVSKVVADGEVGERTFTMLCAACEHICALPASSAYLVAIAFMLKAMALMGVRPALHECALCASSVDGFAGFSYELGGVICHACSVGSAASDIPMVLVSWVDLLLGSTFAQLEALEGAPVLQLLNFADRWAAEHLGLKLKSAVFARMQLMDDAGSLA